MRLIDADALITEVKRMYCTGCNDYHGVRCKACATDDAIDMIEDAPAIDAEPVRHGRWILKVHDEGINYRWNVTAYCSECCDEESEIWAGFFPGVPDFMARDIALDSAKTVKLSNYCPNCGAKMDLKEEPDAHT